MQNRDNKCKKHNLYVQTNQCVKFQVKTPSYMEKQPGQSLMQKMKKWLLGAPICKIRVIRIKGTTTYSNKPVCQISSTKLQAVIWRNSLDKV